MSAIQRSKPITTTLFRGGKADAKTDHMVAEETLLIRVNGESLATLMRLPADHVHIPLVYHTLPRPVRRPHGGGTASSSRTMPAAAGTLPGRREPDATR